MLDVAGTIRGTSLDAGNWNNGSGESIHLDTTQIRFTAGTVERMRIVDDGKIGIGTTTPAYKLDVADSIQGYVLRSSTASGAPIVVSSSAVVSNLNVSYLAGASLTTTFSTTSDILIPSSKSIYTWVTGLGYTTSSGVTSVSLAGGTNNGTLKLIVNGSTTDNISVTGLGSAAYTASTAYAASTHLQSIADGGTGATTAALALTALGGAPASHATTATTYGIADATNYGHVRWVTPGSTLGGALAYSGTTVTVGAGMIYSSTIVPTGTVDLKYNGYFYATQLYEGSTRVSVTGHTHAYSLVNLNGTAATNSTATFYAATNAAGVANAILLGSTNSAPV